MIIQNHLDYTSTVTESLLFDQISGVMWHRLHTTGFDRANVNEEILKFEQDHIVCHVSECSRGFYAFISVIKDGKDAGGRMSTWPVDTYDEALASALNMADCYREHQESSNQ